MCSGLKVFPRFVLKYLLSFLLVSAGWVEAQNQNFNIQLRSEARPYSGKQYGDIWSEGNLAFLGVFSGYSSATTPYGVGIYDITDPQSPSLVSIYTYPLNSSHNQFEQGV